MSDDSYIKKSTITNRKEEHISAVLNDKLVDRVGNFFSGIQLTHRALPELDLNKIDPSVTFLNKLLSFPFLISSMSGGTGSKIEKLNINLAQAANECNVAMSVGSQRVQIGNDKALKSFKLRQYAHDTVLIANMGAVQLNYGYGLTEAQAMIDVLQADALYLHLNPLQESIQPDGNTNFEKLASKISRLNEQLSIPIILKEVGAGLSPEDIKLGLQAGIKIFDLSGRGGTSWSRVENNRNHSNDDGLLFQDWGIPTPVALKLAQPYMNEAKFIVSGGVRDGIDMVKSIILGAEMCGFAKPLLKCGLESTQVCVDYIEMIKRQFIKSLFLLGMPNVESAKNNKELILYEKDWY